MNPVFRQVTVALLLTLLLAATQAARAADTYAVNVNVSGVPRSSTGVVLQNNGGGDRTVTANSNFSFGSFPPGTAYNVTVKSHPSFPAGNCTVTSGTGTIANANVTVGVVCTELPRITTLQADVTPSFARAVAPSWDFPPLSTPPAIDFNLYVSPRSDCDFRKDTFPTCGEKVPSVVPGQPITQFGGQRLKNGQGYFMQVETVFANGTRTLSNPAGARPDELAFNGSVRAITAAPNGTAYLGGSFSSVGVSTGGAVPLDRFTGRLTTPSFPAVAGTVLVIINDNRGGWYVGGSFTHVGGLPHRNLTHILSTGSVDPAWRQFTDGPVHALRLIGQTLYVGGSFNSITDAFGASFPRRNAAGIIPGQGVSFWSPNPNNTVRALTRAFTNRLYMGGDFTAGNGRPAFFAEFQVSDAGSALSSNPTSLDLRLDRPVRALAGTADALYVGGSFTTVGGLPRLRVAKLVSNQGTVVVDPFRPDPGVTDAFAEVNALAFAFGSERILIGGSFTSIRGGSGNVLPRGNIAAVFPNGTPLDWAPRFNAPVDSIAAGGNTIYVGGAFKVVEHGTLVRERFNLAVVDMFTAEISESFRPDPKARVRALSPSGNMVYVGGDFTSLNGVDRKGLAAIDPDGSLALWNPTTSGVVNALVYHDNPFRGPVVYAGGSFSSIGRQSRPNLAALNAFNGAALDSGSFFGTANGPVNALAVLESAGALYVGGSFTSLATSPANNLGKLFLFNGTINLDFKPQPTGPVNALVATTDAVRGSDVVYAGGSFGDVRRHSTTPSRSNFAKVDADSGIALDEFVVNPNGAVTTLALSRDPHAIYLGGAFDRINGTLIGTPGAGGIAAVEIDGSPLLTGCAACFNPGPDGGRPQALAIFPVGFGSELVMAGGSFPNIGVGPISNFAALTGYSFGVRTGFSSGAFVFPTGPVSAVAVSGNKVFIGGSFLGFHGSVDGSATAAARGNFGVVNGQTGRLVE